MLPPLPVDHICTRCHHIWAAGTLMGVPTCVVGHLNATNQDILVNCGGDLVPLRRVTGISAKNNIIVPAEGTPVLVQELHTREFVFGGEALVIVRGLPHLVFNLPRKNLTPGFDEVPHKVWTGEDQP